MSKPVVQTGLSARHPLSLLALTIAALLAGTSAAHDRRHPADELFTLSLDELMNVQVTGAAVRDLGLGEQAETGNPFHWSILDIAASVETIDHNTMQARSLNNVIEAAENLVGRAEFIFFSHDPSAAGWLEPWKWPQAIRFSRFFQAIH